MARADEWTLNFNGVELPVPDMYVWQPSNITKSERNTDQNMIHEWAAVKKTLSVSWESATTAEVNTVLSAMAGEKFTGDLTYFDLQTMSFVTESFYSTVQAITMVRYDDEGNQQYGTLEVHFIQN